MNGCKYVDGAYLRDGEPCRTDDYGDPTRHCQARPTCAQHVGPGEQTCARCLRRARADIRSIVTRTCELLPAALYGGTARNRGDVNSEPANLIGPAADVEAWSWRKVAAMQGRAWHVSQDEDDDDWHPFTVLTRWAWMVAGAYQLPEPDVWTIGNAANLLDRQLHRIANDKGQDFRQLAAEVKACRNHLDASLSIRKHTERGAPCPTCVDAGVQGWQRLVREYAHWCNDEDCRKIHVADDSLDVWVCPRDREHWWNPQGYADHLKERIAG